MIASAIAAGLCGLLAIISARGPDRRGPSQRRGRPAQGGRRRDYPGTAPHGAATGYFDPDRLGQAVDNLVSNAIKYTPSGGTVTVEVGASGNELLCKVTDTGVGMTEEELDQAFTRFFRAATAHSSTIPGAGLGLAITRSIMENHRGQIRLSSAQGHGTTAALALPAAEADVPFIVSA
ncbi:sensor histidine kinase [Pseudarthrobacter phenanthrenivorans]|uniref:sensor histidine kinase n=1 Tax=Pseudarthrobacter phenanthrenivorans TaxID=361575 RepID=UPI002F358168